MKENKPGNILWHDLTVDNAENVSDFYHEVVGGGKRRHEYGRL